MFEPHNKESHRHPRTKTKSILIHTWISNDCRPEHNNKLNFDPPHKGVKFDTHTNTKSIPIPHTTTKLISIPSLQSNQFRSPPYYQVDFDAPTQKSS